MPRPILLKLPLGSDFGADADGVVDIARRAEAAGFHGVVMSDHVVMGARTDRYTWGPFPFPPDAPWLEPMTLLTAIAAVTERIRVATAILIAPLRPAALLAKTAATLDQLSHGRLDLGVGTGWQVEEFDAEGLDFERRGAMLTDTIAACRALWGPSPASFTSDHVSFSEIWCDPKPVQPGGPTILFSGTLNARNIDRIVRLGDGWIPIMGESPEGIRKGIETLRGPLADAGRDVSSLLVRVPLPPVRDDDGRADVDATLAQVEVLTDAGAKEFVLPLTPFIAGASDLDPWFAHITPALADLGA